MLALAVAALTLSWFRHGGSRSWKGRGSVHLCPSNIKLFVNLLYVKLASKSKAKSKEANY